jgi:hypothetical protein
MRSIFLSVVFTLLVTVAFSQTDSAKAEMPKITDTANAAKIVVIRGTGHIGSAVNMRVYVNKIPYCKVKNNRYSVFYVQPGTHMFYTTTWDKGGPDEKFGLKLPVEAGKTYYLSMRIKPRFMTTEMFLEEITLNTATPLLEKYKQDDCN